MNIVGGLILGSALASSAEVEARREVGEYRLCVPADEWQAVALVVGARVCWLYQPFSGWVYRIPVAAEIVAAKRSKIRVRFVHNVLTKERWVQAKQLKNVRPA